MTETHAQAVERLKQNTVAFGLMNEKDKALLMKVGKKHCEYYSLEGVWLCCELELPFKDGNVYRIRPDYQSEPPKPEYIDFPVFIESRSKELRVKTPNEVDYGIDYAVRFPDFRGFWLKERSEKNNEYRTHLDNVAKHLAEGLTVVARFERSNP